MLNRPRLLKLLMLTQSPSDGEALAAIRKVNRTVREEGLTWETLLAHTPLRAPAAAASSRPVARPGWEEIGPEIFRRKTPEGVHMVSQQRDGWRWTLNGVRQTQVSFPNADQAMMVAEISGSILGTN